MAAIVATCSLAGLAGGMALSMLAETHRAAREVRGGGSHARVAAGPTTWLGVQIVDAKRRGCGGARITSVTADSPADRVGFRAGDVIVAYGGDRICDDDHLIGVVRASSVGATPEISVRRGATEVTLHPTLGLMPARIRANLRR